MITTDELWEALKEVAGSNPDKSKIHTIVQLKRSDVKKALGALHQRQRDLTVNQVPSGSGGSSPPAPTSSGV